MDFSIEADGDASVVDLAMSYEPASPLALLAAPVLVVDNWLALNVLLPNARVLRESSRSTKGRAWSGVFRAAQHAALRRRARRSGEAVWPLGAGNTLCLLLAYPVDEVCGTARLGFAVPPLGLELRNLTASAAGGGVDRARNFSSNALSSSADFGAAAAAAAAAAAGAVVIHGRSYAKAPTPSNTSRPRRPSPN